MSVRGTVLTLLLLGSSPRAQDEAKDPLEKRISIARTGTLEQHLALLRGVTGMPVALVDSEETLDTSRKIEVVLKDVKAANAVYWVTAVHELGFVRRDGQILVGADFRGYRGDPVLRTYEADGLSFTYSRVTAPRLTVGKELRPALEVMKEEPKPPTDEIVDTIPDEQILPDLIKMNVAPGTWEGRFTLDRDPMKRLVVNQSPPAHRELEWFLGALRAFPTCSVTVSVDVADADESLSGLVAPGAPAVLDRDAADAAARRIRSSKGRSLQASGVAGEAFHSLLSEESAGVTGFMRGRPILGKWFGEVTLLDVRPCVLDHGRSVFLDLRLSIGHTRSLESLQTRPGLLPLRERQLAELGTSLAVPSGGGVVLSLPARNPSNPRPQVALVRASAGKGGEGGTPAFLMSPLGGAEEESLLEKLKAVPATGVDLKDVPVSGFAAWLRDAAGVNVVISPDVAERKLTLRVKEVSFSAVLQLAVQSVDLTARASREAIWIGPRQESRPEIQTCVVSIRDVMPGASDYPARPSKDSKPAAVCDFEDVANLIKNSVHRDAWEEADGKSVQHHNGLLILRNSGRVLRDCLSFVESRRSAPPRLVRVRADSLVLPASAADELLGAAEDPATVDAAQLRKVLKAGTVLETLAWACLDQQQTSLSWDRSRDHLHSVDGDDPILRADVSPSTLELRPTTDKDGKGVRVDLRYEDRRLIRISEVKVADDLTVQVPSGQSVSAKGAIQIPADRSAVWRWSVPAKEGEAPACRLLILTVTPAAAK